MSFHIPRDRELWQRRKIVRGDVQKIIRNNAGADEMAAGLEVRILREGEGKGVHVLFQRARAD